MTRKNSFFVKTFDKFLNVSMSIINSVINPKNFTKFILSFLFLIGIISSSTFLYTDNMLASITVSQPLMAILLALVIYKRSVQQSLKTKQEILDGVSRHHEELRLLFERTTQTKWDQEFILYQKIRSSIKKIIDNVDFEEELFPANDFHHCITQAVTNPELKADIEFLDLLLSETADSVELKKQLFTIIHSYEELQKFPEDIVNRYANFLDCMKNLNSDISKKINDLTSKIYNI